MDHHTQNFGVGESLEEVKNNVGLTIVQRDNIWHPYYEVKLDEDDMASRMKKKIAENQANAALGNAKIDDIEGQLAALELAEKEKAEQKALADAAAANPNKDEGQKKKKTFDLAALQKQLGEKESTEEAKKEDPFAVRIWGIPPSVMQQELQDAMQDKFGKVEHVYIPPINNDRGAGPVKRTQIAIIRFLKKESATRAVEEGEIVVEFAALRIERALAKPRRERDDGGDRMAFDSFTKKKF